jgi:hypothetical protein
MLDGKTSQAFLQRYRFNILNTYDPHNMGAIPSREMLLKAFAETFCITLLKL